MVDRMSCEAIDDEPWVYLPDGDALADWGKAEEIVYNQRNRQIEKAVFFRRAFDFLVENNVAGDYLEFGCHRCRTFRMALTESRRRNLDQMRFYAFDSFEGLPTPVLDYSVEKWTGGALSTTEAAFRSHVTKHGIALDRVETIKGFYSDSLTEDRRAAMIEKGRPIAFATIDCDFYESAVPVFDFIEPLLQEGSVIYMDDLFAGTKGSPHKGVARAFLEYQQRSRFRFLPHLSIGWWGRSYIAYIGDAVVGSL